jgi:hypothetical protein
VPATIRALAATNDFGVLDPARAGAPRGLQGALEDVPQAMGASGAEAAAKGTAMVF